MNLRQKAKRFKRLYEMTLPQRKPFEVTEKRIRKLCIKRIVRDYEPIEYVERQMVEEIAKGIYQNDLTRTTYEETPLGKIITKEIQIVAE